MNPAALATFRAKAAAQSEALFPCTVLIDAMIEPVAARTAGLKRREKLRTGGFVNDDDVIFRVRKELLTSEPQSGWRITWVERNETYRIDHIDPGGDNTPHYRLGCNSVDS